MKVIFFIILFALCSCGYPDIDSVPNFNNVKLTEVELFDLCQLSSTDKSKTDTCLKNK